MRIAPGIALRMSLEIVLTTVYFDNQPFLKTDEIEDMTVARGLALKVVSAVSP